MRLLGFDEATDQAIWQYAKAHDFAIVSQDSDYAEMAALYGPPPKVVWIRCGNQPTDAIAQRLLNRKADIEAFGGDITAACLEVY